MNDVTETLHELQLYFKHDVEQTIKSLELVSPRSLLLHVVSIFLGGRGGSTLKLHRCPFYNA